MITVLAIHLPSTLPTCKKKKICDSEGEKVEPYMPVKFIPSLTQFIISQYSIVSQFGYRREGT